jgi:hypothetical protein
LPFYSEAPTPYLIHQLTFVTGFLQVFSSRAIASSFVSTFGAGSSSAGAGSEPLHPIYPYAPVLPPRGMPKANY